MNREAQLVLLVCMVAGCRDATERRRDAIAKLQADLRSFARAESAFVADSGHPTRTLPPTYGFAKRKGTAGPRVEIREYGWTAMIMDSRTSMTCMLVAMLDRTSGRYTPGQPRCSSENGDNVAVLRHPQPAAASHVTPITVINESPSTEPRTPRDWGPVNNTPPPIPYIATNTCEGEGCASSGTWAACTTLVAFEDKQPGAAQVFTIQAGDKFTALTADMHVEVPGMVVFRHNFWTTWSDGEEPLDTIRFTPADTLYVLNYVGEGLLIWWFRGQVVDGHQFWDDDPDEPLASNPSDTVALVRRTKTTWWVRARNAAGREGWIVGDLSRMATSGYMDGIERCLHTTKG